MALLQELIDMKLNVVMTHGILQSRQKPFLNWKKIVEFKIESLVKSEQELKCVYDLVNKAIHKIFEYLKILYTQSCHW